MEWETEGPPLDGYDGLGAREVMRRILDLPRETLLRLQAYEQRNQRRTQVLGAIRRAIDRRDARADGQPARRLDGRSDGGRGGRPKERRDGARSSRHDVDRDGRPDGR